MAHEGTVNVDRSRLPSHNGHDDLGSRVGRSPMIEFKHTVDDTLLAATSKLYLPLRAMLHRNGDTMICMSHSVTEKAEKYKEAPPPTSKNAVGSSSSPSSSPGFTGGQRERIILLTDKHLYITDPPRMAVFAPCPSGGCFSWREFTKAQSVKSERGTDFNVILNFVNATLAVSFGSAVEMDRCGRNIHSITGSILEAVNLNDRNEHSRHFSRDHYTRRMTVGSAASGENGGGGSLSGTTNTTGTDAQPGGRKRILGSAGDDGNGSAIATSASGGGGGGPGGIENMLRFILDNDKNAEGDYESLYPGKETQTDNPTLEIGCQTEVLTVDRCNSPIIGMDGEDGEQEEEMESNYSDFDHGDVWKSLSGPSTGGAMLGGHHGGAPFSNKKQTGSGRSSGGANPLGSSSSPPNSGGGGATPMSRGSGVTFRSDPNNNHGNNNTISSFGGASDAGGNSSTTGLSRVRSQRMLQHQQGGGGGAYDESPYAGGEADDTLASYSAGSPGAEGGMSGGRGGHQSTAGGSSGGGSGSANHTASFSAWLGVLAQYQQHLVECGIDSANKLGRLTDREVDTVMDSAGIHKHGHRVLLQSKIGVFKQAKTRK